MNPETGLPNGRWCAFSVKTMSGVSDDKTTYTLYSLTDEEIELLVAERKLAVQINGPIINHDLSFRFSTGAINEKEMFVKYKPFTPNKDSEMDVFDISDIANPNPQDVAHGKVKFP
jgi:hypothetical protein